MFIVIPMLIETLTMPLIYEPLLGGDPRNALTLGGVLMLLGAAATLRVREGADRGGVTAAREAGSGSNLQSAKTALDPTG